MQIHIRYEFGNGETLEDAENISNIIETAISRKNIKGFDITVYNIPVECEE